jgi:hypothetical protein
MYYSNRHQNACFKAAEGLHPPYRAALSQQYSVASFATLQILNCLHSPGICSSCCNDVRFCCDLEACNLVTATIVDMWPENNHDVQEGEGSVSILQNEASESDCSILPVYLLSRTEERSFVCPLKLVVETSGRY